MAEAGTAEVVRRCVACGAAQSEGIFEGDRCEECRSELTFAPPAVARGPEGWCPEHPDRPLSGVCAECGVFTCVDCDVSVRGIRLCERCRTRLQRTLVAPVAWEERREIGTLRAWWRTTAGVISRPDTFFDQLDPQRDLGAALLFALAGSFLHRALWMVQTAFAGVYGLIDGSIGVWSSAAGSAAGSALAKVLGVFGAHLGLAIVTPLAMFGLFMLVAWAQHLALRTVGAGGEQGVTGTLKVACYALGGTAWLGLLPFVGPLIQLAWWTVIMVLGTARVHRRSTTRTLVVVMPMALFCGAPIAALGVAGLLSILAG